MSRESDRWSDSEFDDSFSTSPSSTETNSKYEINKNLFSYLPAPIKQDENNIRHCKHLNAFKCEIIPKKKKKKSKWKSICLSGCRYEVVRRVVREMGLKEAGENDNWILYWTDSSIPFDKLLDIKRFQKVNHFPGMSEICRKDLLARNLKRMLKIFPKEYNFFPRTWCLPADFSDLLAFVGTKKKTLICKPDTGCQGRGIFIIRSLKMLNPVEKLVVQHYITKPFLIDGYKFDLRLYVLITAVEPEFRIYVYNEGLARFATVKYEKPNGRNANNMFMHLTNYAVNKHSNYYVNDDEAGSKRKLSAVNEWWNAHGYSANEIWKRVDDVIIKTMIAASGTLKHNYRTCFPNHIGVNACFEILGFDVLLDHKLMPYVLEVNLSPSFHVDTLIDKEVKEGLIRNTFELLHLDLCNPRRCAEEDRKKARIRLLNSIRKADDSTKYQLKLEQQELANETVSSTELYELQHIGNYRLIYPIHSYAKIYDKYFLNSGCLYQETAASRAREECTRVQRIELLKQQGPRFGKAKSEGGDKKKRVQTKLPKVPSSTRSKSLPKTTVTSSSRNVSSSLKTQSHQGSESSSSIVTSSQSSTQTGNVSQKSSFQDNWKPVPIDYGGKEEVERVKELLQREHLIRSSGIVESINQLMVKQPQYQKDESNPLIINNEYRVKLHHPYKSEIAKNIDYLISSLTKQQLCHQIKMNTVPVLEFQREYRLPSSSSNNVNNTAEKFTRATHHPYNSIPWRKSFLSTDAHAAKRRCSTKTTTSFVERGGLKNVSRDSEAKTSSNTYARVRVTRAYLARVESNLEKIHKMDSLKKKPTTR